MKLVLNLLGLLLISTSFSVAQSDTQSQAKLFLMSYQNRVAQLSQSSSEEELTAVSEYFSNDTVLVPAILLPAPLYQASRTRQTVQNWINELPGYFWEGFTYSLDTSQVQWEDLPHEKNQIRLKLTLPVVLHGLSLTTHQRHWYRENQAFILSAAKNGNRFWKIEAIYGTGCGMKEIPLNIRQLLSYHEDFQSYLMQLVFQKTSNQVKQEILDKFKPYVSADARIFEWKKHPGKKMTLNEIAELRLSAEQAALCRLDAFDLYYQGNFFQDRNGSWQSDVITLRGVSVWIDGKLNYQTRQTDTIPGEPPFREKTRLTYLAFTL